MCVYGIFFGNAALFTYLRITFSFFCKTIWFVWVTVPNFLFVVVPLLVIRSAFSMFFLRAHITLQIWCAPDWLIAKLMRSFTGEENTSVVRTSIIMKIHGSTWPYALPLCFEDRG